MSKRVRVGARASHAPGPLPPRMNFANRAAPAAAAAAAVSRPPAAAAVASSAQPPPLAAGINDMDEISAKFNRDSVILIGSLMLTFDEAEECYLLHTVRGVEKDGVRLRAISGASGSAQ